MARNHGGAVGKRFGYDYREILRERRRHDDVGPLEHPLFFLAANVAKHCDLVGQIQAIDLAAKFCLVVARARTRDRERKIRPAPLFQDAAGGEQILNSLLGIEAADKSEPQPSAARLAMKRMRNLNSVRNQLDSGARKSCASFLDLALPRSGEAPTRATQPALHTFSHSDLNPSRRDPLQRCSAPCGVHTTGRFSIRAASKVGIVGNEYAACR